MRVIVTILLQAICCTVLAANAVSLSVFEKEELESFKSELKRFGIRAPFFEPAAHVSHSINASFTNYIIGKDLLESKKFHIQLFGGSRWFISRQVYAVAICDEYVKKTVTLGFSKDVSSALEEPILVYDGQGCFIRARYNLNGEYLGSF
mgnify:CR=1 FL=1